MRLGLLLSAAIAFALAATPTELLSAAVKEAIDNVMKRNKFTDMFVGEDNRPQGQKANGGSIDAQKIGDIMQEATGILIKKNGMGIFSKLQGVDAMAILKAQWKVATTNGQTGVNGRV